MCDTPAGFDPVTRNAYVPGDAEGSTYIVTDAELVLPAAAVIWLASLPLNVAVTPVGPEYDSEIV